MKLIIDIETTCWKTKLEQDHEPIQLSAILEIANGDLLEIKEFDSYIKPIRHPILSAFCTELTGITQELVDNADCFTVVFNKFLEWIKKHIDPEKVIFYSWGTFDYLILERESRRNGIYFPFYRFINIKTLFKITNNRPRTKQLGVQKALNIKNMTFIGRQHNSLYDTRNIYKLLTTCH